MRLCFGATALILALFMSMHEGIAAGSGASPVDCPAALDRIQKAVHQEGSRLGRGITFVRNTNGTVVSYAGGRPISSDDTRLMVRQALELLDGSANALTDTMARAASSMPKMTRHDQGVWREMTKRTPLAAPALHTWVGRFGGSGADYKDAQRIASGWEQLGDDLRSLIEKYQGHFPPNVATTEAGSALWNTLSADATALGLNANIAAAAAAAAVGDLPTAQRYSNDLGTRIAAANNLVKDGCANTTNAAAPPAHARPAETATPTPPPAPVRHGMGGAKAAAIVGIGAAGTTALLVTLVHPPCCTPPSKTCDSSFVSPSLACSSINQVLNPGECAASQAAAQAYCQCEGYSTYITNATSFDIKPPSAVCR